MTSHSLHTWTDWGDVPPNLRLHADERLRGAYGAPPSLAGEACVMPKKRRGFRL